MKYLIDNETGKLTVVLAHGAGAPMDSEFMDNVASGLASHGLRVVRFEFPYMAARREDGKKRGPNGKKVLMDTYRQVVGEQGPASTLVIGGKSMGGRIASMLADELNVAALVCLGYPFHPPGKPEKLRTAHLEALQTPTLIVQGTRDRFGKPEEVADYELPSSIRVHWVDAGDHSLKPTKRSGRTQSETIAEAVDQVARFADEIRE